MRILQIVGLVGLYWFAMAGAAQGTVTVVGNVVSTAVGQDMVDFKMDSGAAVRVQMLAPDLARVRANPSGTLAPSTAASGAVAPTGLTAPGTKIFDTASVTYLLTAQMLVVVQKSPFQTVMVRSDNSLIVADAANAIAWDSSSGIIFTQKYAPPDEHYFGLGLLGGPIDRRGRQLVLLNQDSAGYGEFTYPLYASYPYYYGVRGGLAYGVFFDNPATPFFNMDSTYQGVVTFGARQGELDYYVMAGPSPAQVSETYARLTGFAPLPPKWTLGYQQSGFGYKSEAQILTLAQNFRQQTIPCDALYFDVFYEQGLRMFTWDPVAYPSPQTMNQTLASSGFHKVAIFDSGVLYNDPLWAPLSSLGYFVTDGTGAPLLATVFLGQVSFLDFSNSTTRLWYAYSLGNFMQSGIDGVWNDLDSPSANYIPNATYGFDGNPRTDQQARNLYALNQVRASYEAQQMWRPTLRPWVLTAPGYAGSQRYSAGFSGDTLSTFDSLRVSVEISQHMGLSGQVQFGHDIGGFLGTPSAELYLRWLAFDSYTPFFRTHSYDPNNPREPWMYGEPYTTMARTIINQHYHILPYLYSLMETASRAGDGVLVPLFYYFPADTVTYSQDQEYMLGPSLLVAPVLQAGVTSLSVYLPAGANWIDHASDTTYAGGQSVMVNAPLGSIPTFIKAGSIIPGSPTMQFVGDSSGFSTVMADVYPGPDSSFSMYEDDGSTMNYVTGGYLRTQLSKTTLATGTTLKIQRTQGSWVPPTRSWSLVMHAVTARPSGVQLNGASLTLVASSTALAGTSQGWFYDSTNHLVLLKGADTGTLSFVITN